MDETEEIDDCCDGCGHLYSGCTCDEWCSICEGVNNDHDIKCPHNETPFAMLIKDGYD